MRVRMRRSEDEERWGELTCALLPQVFLYLLLIIPQGVLSPLPQVFCTFCSSSHKGSLVPFAVKYRSRASTKPTVWNVTGLAFTSARYAADAEGTCRGK